MIQSRTDAVTTQSEPHTTEHTERPNPIRALQTFGQSVWLDYLRRSLFTSGEFTRLIDEDGLRGATSNPSIFEKAIAGSTDYLTRFKVSSGTVIWNRWRCTKRSRFATSAMQRTCFARSMTAPPARTATSAWKSSPYLAHDTAATIDEAKRLLKAVAPRDVMIKVPAPSRGFRDSRTDQRGHQRQITLLFGIERTKRSHERTWKPRDSFVRNGGDPARVCSVASFFVSRIDTRSMHDCDHTGNRDRAGSAPH